MMVMMIFKRQCTSIMTTRGLYFYGCVAHDTLEPRVPQEEDPPGSAGQPQGLEMRYRTFVATVPYCP